MSSLLSRVRKVVVVHEPQTVVHTDPAGSSRHGKYKDPEARKAYRREWAKRARAKAPNP